VCAPSIEHALNVVFAIRGRDVQSESRGDDNDDEDEDDQD
jgi:hypothetical protein